MSRKLWKPLAAIAALAAFSPAHAQARYRGMPEPNPAPDRNFQQRQAEPPHELQPRQEPFQSGRLSPEERRQLRRDIHDAGRELYRRNPPQR